MRKLRLGFERTGMARGNIALIVAAGSSVMLVLSLYFLYIAAAGGWEPRGWVMLALGWLQLRRV